jgi:hypothetical protein
MLFCTVTPNDISDPHPLPFRLTIPDGEVRTDLAGQLTEGHISLDDLRAWGEWPVSVVSVAIDPATEVLDGRDKEKDDILGVVTVRERKRVLTAEEVAQRLARAKAEKLAALAQKRWEVEIGGIMVDGARIETDDRSKLLLLGKRTKAVENSEGTTRWKAGSGQFVDLPNTFIVAAADAVEAHVQACFDREGELTDAILDPAVDTLAKLYAIDISAGWPA